MHVRCVLLACTVLAPPVARATERPTLRDLYEASELVALVSVRELGRTGDDVRVILRVEEAYKGRVPRELPFLWKQKSKTSQPRTLDQAHLAFLRKDDGRYVSVMNDVGLLEVDNILMRAGEETTPKECGPSVDPTSFPYVSCRVLDVRKFWHLRLDGVRRVLASPSGYIHMLTLPVVLFADVEKQLEEWSKGLQQEPGIGPSVFELPDANSREL